MDYIGIVERLRVDARRWDEPSPLRAEPPKEAELYLRRYDPHVFFRGDGPVDITSTFIAHTRRTPPSRFPGVDSDLRLSSPTEGLARALKPDVLSPVSGVVVYSGERWNKGVQIKDESGYIHAILHMHLDYEAPVTGRIYPLVVGERVLIGQPIGKLGNVGAEIDHVHHTMIDPKGKLVDPRTLFYGRDGRVMPSSGLPTGEPIFYDNVFWGEHNNKA
ncbi:M23 family metallopeptidase [Rhizobium laguerreae]|uniref:M23 family metallopeptidase n=1 Tax=Rhizobium laguerreae TaxID=1076926 RepID=UPI001478F88A|nr:M23 family metallopeptidase [Rhizobium laguerreae]NNG74286.1 M23 family metallopeptidase [Rhizobium laguerreae]